MDTVFSRILTGVRPAAVRQKFAELDPECFTAQREAIVLVRVYTLLWYTSAVVIRIAPILELTPAVGSYAKMTSSTGASVPCRRLCTMSTGEVLQR